MNEGKVGTAISVLIILGLLIWWFLVRVDYKDVWWSGTEVQRVIYCGNSIEPHCSTGETYYIPVTHIGKTGEIHSFELNFTNGGHIETTGSCDQAAKDMYDFDRFCRTTGTDEYGNSYMYIVAPK